MPAILVALRTELSDSTVYPLGARRTLVVLSGTYLGGFVASINQTITATALPRIVDDLGGLRHYSWVFTAYILASIVTIPLFGKLSDVHGRRPAFVAAIVLFSVGSVLSGLAPTLPVLVIGRAVQGLGAGGLGPLGLAVMGDVIAPRARGKWQAANGMVLACSAVGGPLLGGWFTDHASWRLAFFASLPLSAAALGVVWFGFGRFGHRERKPIDWTGALLLTVGTGAGLFGLSDGGVDLPWLSAPIVGALLASVLLIATLVMVGRRAEDPILPFALLRRRRIAAADIALFCVGASMLGAVTYVPLFVQAVVGGSATSSAAALIPLTLSWIAASIVAGQVVSRTGRPRQVLLVGPPLAGVGFALLTTAGADAAIGEVIRDVVIIGAGLGLMIQTLLVVVQDAAPPGQLGAATASAEFSRWIGALTGVAAMGSILATRVGPSAARGAAPAVVAAGLHGAFAVGLGIAALAFAAALALPDVHLRDRFDEARP